MMESLQQLKRSMRQFLPPVHPKPIAPTELKSGKKRTRSEAVALARKDLNRMIGRHICVHWVYGFSSSTGSSEERFFENPIICRVTGGDPEHDTIGWIDPYWDLESNHPELSDLKHIWTFGNGYEYILKPTTSYA